GNQANLGPETEARHLASGLNTRDAGAVEAPRGVATQMLQGGVPVIHLLNLRGLAAHLDRSALGADPRTVATLVIIDRWRRAVALIGLIAVALWVALRLTPQATSLNSHPIPEGAPKP
ncbi:hypothetical protein JXA47_12760, partial [Candidatus Sumerlaeota bacterium]|nr:hypothetical protein [Candidatus Sumerlaeota bacterium]